MASADPAPQVVVFAPVGRDGALMSDLLRREGIAAIVCSSVVECCAATGDAAALILTEEVFDQPGFEDLAATLREQPPWSDIPVLLFAGSERAGVSARTIELLDVLPNVTLLERPIRLAMAASIIRAAVRARQRQLEVRDLLLALRTAREHAETANRMKDEFLATLSHELRTPLNAILGWTAMLRHNEVEPSRVDRALEVIDRNARAQAQLVEDVLDMARVITGKLRLELTPVSLRGVLEAAVEALRPAADSKGVAMCLEHIAAPITIHGDADRLQQVFWNLLSNAVKFTQPGGSIVVRADMLDLQVRVSVIDSGIGLEPAFLPHVFDRFRQADQSVTRGHGGLGLGLAIVKHLVELHGGQVDVRSDGVGSGSTFRVFLPVPVFDETATRESSAADPAGFDIRLPGRRVLVVDDDAATRELLDTLFRHADAEVLVVDSAPAAFEALEHNTPDVIIADIGMPGEDGCALLRRIRQLPGAAADVPAIALSAYTRSEDRASARAAGFTDFIGKPASPQQLLTMVARLVG